MTDHIHTILDSVLDHFQENSKMSIQDPLACGFAKVIMYLVITETHQPG